MILKNEMNYKRSSPPLTLFRNRTHKISEISDPSISNAIDNKTNRIMRKVNGGLLGKDP